ncbi:MAG: chromate transporter [Candidatus Gastranaerophilales bacterium]|nr:chromate transporter [Candidatus Gastranaerophilales bacterium]
MFKLYFLLFYEFMKIGVFAIGGGYAALPFLYFLQSQYNWFSSEELTNMIAVSNITPGPIGINMATYTGYTTAGFIGAVISTTGIVFIPFFLVIFISKLLDKFKTCRYIESIFLGLRPASCALLMSIGIKLLLDTVLYSKELPPVLSQFDFKAVLLFVLLIVPFAFIKKNPLLIIIAGAIGGVILKSF